MVDHSVVRIPATCPMCGQEYLVGLGLETISDRLATGRSIKLYCECAHHSVTWVANEIERAQIREYTAAVQGVTGDNYGTPLMYFQAFR
jgi:hypothetical protein